MAETFQFDLVSPERLIVSEPVVQVVVPGAEGEFTALPRHAPFMTTLRPGVLRVTSAGGGEQRIFVFGGFAEVNPESITVLAEEAVPVEELKVERVDLAIKDAEEDLADAQGDQARTKAQTRLDQLKAQRAAL